jgi:hypothetical protein
MFDFVAVTSHDWNLEGKVWSDEKKLQTVIRKAKKVIIKAVV